MMTEGVGGEWSSAVVPAHTTPGAWRRFIAKVVLTPGCWYWVGAIADDGYGRFADHEGRVVRVSRYLLGACSAPLPAELVAEHWVCDEPICVRLTHLRAATQVENLETARQRDRAANGHRAGSADRRGMAAFPRHPRRAPRPCRWVGLRPDQARPGHRRRRLA